MIIERRFCGPTDSANGGYVCGLLARHAPHDVTVRLLAPPPLDTALRIAEHDDTLELLHGDRVLARARPNGVGDLPVPPAPCYQAAVEASRQYAGLSPAHPAPRCFVCGPRRPENDGLSIFPGPAGLGGMVAAAWTPDTSLDAGDGEVRSEFLWSALDCPGYHAMAPDLRPMLLGEMTAVLHRPVRVGERCVVTGWRLGAEGRKYAAGTALWSAGGEICGRARAIWIELQTDSIPPSPDIMPIMKM